MSKEQIIVTIVVAIIGVIGTSIGGGFAFAQFLIKRKDEKEENTIQKKIQEEVEKAKQEVRAEFEKGLIMRGEEGRERFEINSKQIEANTNQLAENGKQIEEILGIVKNQAEQQTLMTESITSINSMLTVTAEAQRNSNYDRLLMVANKIIKSNTMTITDKTNLKQLYKSWKELKGEDPKVDTMYEECMKLTPTLD